MKKRMLRLILCALTLSLLLPLSACAKKAVADDIPLSSLVGKTREVLSSDMTYSEVDVSYLADYFAAPDYVRNAIILRADIGNDLDEVGFFHVTDGNADAMRALVSDYLARSYEQNKSWYDSYIPRQTPKLRDAQVTVIGNYVFYTVLDAHDRQTVKDAIQAEFE